MAQTSVENKICNACGSEVRPHALFCYNCGGAITAEKSLSSENGSSIDTQSQRVEDETIVELAEEKQTVGEEIHVRKKSEKLEKPDAHDKTKLESAAALRRKSKSLQSKTVEVIWEEHEDAPNAWFISVAVALTILAAAILFLAMYLK
jgi:predicted nucleic acid-binding Zn ribbon protein